MSPDASQLWRSATRFEKALLAALGGALAAAVLPLGSLSTLAKAAAAILGFWIGLRILRRSLPLMLWRLRHRLMIAYVFIALVPVVLIALLAALVAYTVVGQVAVYVVTSELERRTALMISIAEWITQPGAASRAEALSKSYDVLEPRLPGLEVIHQGATQLRYPASAALTPPPAEWGDAGGLLIKDGLLYLWAHIVRPEGRTTAAVPITARFLTSLAPNLGQFSIARLDEELGQPRRAVKLHRIRAQTDEEEAPRNRIPDPAFRLDIAVQWFTLVPVYVWDSPGRIEATALSVRTRPSAIFGTVYAQRVDTVRGLVPALILFFSVLFLIVEIIAMVIGASLTRTITGAVHELYQGTQHVREGDFAHRIHLKGRDQLAALGDSFNSMTANIERLLKVAKENERLQAELEIARAVQGQLFPRTIPALKTLCLEASCSPARTVSGDYYDYQRLEGSKLALAIGDVAGKGISAALLMATVQSALRTQLRHPPIAPAPLVSQLNQFLYAHTAPEKYATFFLCVYDDDSGDLCYTNAGHLPPILLRSGDAIPLDVNGMVVGAFPFAAYSESNIRLEPGDLLLFYTDGITEPENAYGEQFGEERLIEILKRTRDRSPGEILASIVGSVKEWSGDGEQQDDLTLLLAKRF
ncbi:MAG: SpoIIE family protein phosphatase [Bryobacteraceae bacterium]|nr:SpoIIE family protein phosphatase [Bryobacteraceae bacterium]